MWNRYGLSGLEKQRHTGATSEFKKKIVRLILEKGVPLSHVRIDYRIGKTALQRWLSIVRKQGYEGLNSKERRGRPSNSTMSRPKKKEPQTELEKLQVENALLKKVTSLVEEQEARARLSGQKPSTN